MVAVACVCWFPTTGESSSTISWRSLADGDVEVIGRIGQRLGTLALVEATVAFQPQSEGSPFPPSPALDIGAVNGAPLATPTRFSFTLDGQFHGIGRLDSTSSIETRETYRRILLVSEKGEFTGTVKIGNPFSPSIPSGQQTFGFRTELVVRFEDPASRIFAEHDSRIRVLSMPAELPQSETDYRTLFTTRCSVLWDTDTFLTSRVDVISDRYKTVLVHEAKARGLNSETLNEAFRAVSAASVGEFHALVPTGALHARNETDPFWIVIWKEFEPAHEPPSDLPASNGIKWATATAVLYTAVRDRNATILSMLRADPNTGVPIEAK